MDLYYDQITLADFGSLIHDLLCLRDNELWQPRQQVELLAKVIIGYATSGSSEQEVRVEELVHLAMHWDASMANPHVCKAGGHNLPALCSEGLIERIQELHRQRATSSNLDANSNPAWVYVSAKCHGEPVGQDVLAQRDGWCFKDHGDGTGIVYWWPPFGTPGRETLLTDAFIVLPVQRVAANDEDSMPKQKSSDLKLPPSARSITDPSQIVQQNIEVATTARADDTELVMQASAACSSKLRYQDSTLGGITNGKSVGTISKCSQKESDGKDLEEPRLCKASRARESSMTRTRRVHTRSRTDKNLDIARSAANPICSNSLKSSVHHTYAEVDQRLAALGLKARDVGGGGNCFFRSLAAQHPDLMNSPELHILARSRTVRYMQSNEDMFRHYVGLPYTDYIERMKKPGAWVEGEAELVAAAAAWNVNIHVWGRSDAHDCRVLSPNPNIETRNVCMVHYQDQHYRVLERT